MELLYNRFNKPIIADIVGDAAKNLLQSIAESQIQGGSGSTIPVSICLPPSSVLVSENFISKIVEASELHSYTSCRLGKITQVIFKIIPLQTY